ncbi:RICIN domain-containing protein [Streptomyces gilvifuscus]|uniref:RICIN domain-containing protein n=2 Tax=Streptomyces TaxID=1883 RepID=A0ABT5G317_9ACTN|nr:RICIN domain-containing protein [Streptomyces gilvifuscus]MDC2959204.1 RICIN domain-containing protein [Streptomyces gilvifuscus]
MAGAYGTDNGVATEGGVYADVPDARLTELLRARTATVYPALRELRARHQPAVLAYARLCTASESAARQLASQAFTLAARQTARGAEPSVPLRHELLLLAGRLAASWAGDERSAGLDPGLLFALSTSGPDTVADPPMLAAFRSLPSRAQGLVWYGVVEREAERRTALLLGLTREDVAHETPSALQAMAQACLRSRLAASGDPRCGNFGRLIEESVRPDNPRESADLRAHMVHCAHCTAAYTDLSALRDSPRTALAEGLLPWSGTAYATRATTPTEPPGGPTARPGTGRRRPKAGGRSWFGGRAASGGQPESLRRSASGGRTESGRRSASGGRTDFHGRSRSAGRPGALAPAGVPAGTRFLLGPVAWPVSRRLLLTSVALGVALTPLLLFLLSRGDGSPSSSAGGQPGAVDTPTAPPQVTVTATVSTTPSTAPSPSPSAKSPSPTKSSTPSRSAKPGAAPTHAPDGTYAQIVNVSTGRCLDIDGDLNNGTAVVTAPCSGAATQRWRVDAARGIVQSYADSDFCLDSRGSVDRGVGIWDCGSVDGDHGQNLRFTVDSDGVIRPAIAIETAVTPGGGDGVSLRPLSGGREQRWRAGAS